ncbi:hypothetical protein [Burkholderia metallica]
MLEIGISSAPFVVFSWHTTSAKQPSNQTQMSLKFEILSAANEINRTIDDHFKPNTSQLSLELNRFTTNTSGIIATPSKNNLGYELIYFSAPIDPEESIESTGADLWKCAK